MALVKIGKWKKDIEIADSILAQTKGLMFQDPKPMLFKFSKPGKYGIWMFGMKFSIDIIFLDENRTIQEIQYNAKPLTCNPSTWKLYKPRERCVYVLEVPAGTAHFLTSMRMVIVPKAKKQSYI